MVLLNITVISLGKVRVKVELTVGPGYPVSPFSP